MRSSTCLCSALVFLVTPQSHNAKAQVVLYDNLDIVRSDGNQEDYLTPLASDDRFAQQFILGDHTNIDQVTVSLLRPRPGATGSLRLELWRDNGSGQSVPDDQTGKIADLGKIVDVAQIPVGTFDEYTFDNLILGLEPNKPYWIVTDYEEVRNGGGNRNVGLAVVHGGDPDFPDPPNYDPSAGTNGAAHTHGNQNRNPHWDNLNNLFGLEHFYQAMKVEAMEEAEVVGPHGDLNHGGALDAIDIDIVSSAIRQALTDTQYDINQDGQVTIDDRSHLVHNLANTYFGDSNVDGEFNSGDATTVLQAGEYEDNITLNSTWAEGDWDGNGDFDKADIVLALQDGGYAQGLRAVQATYEAIQANGRSGDAQASVIYNAGTGELSVDARAGVELTSINIDSATGIFTAEAAQSLGGSFDNDTDINIFKATFGGSFGSLTFGNVALTGLSEESVLGDLTVIGSLTSGGDLGAVDLVYVPEPSTSSLAMIGLSVVCVVCRYRHNFADKPSS